MIEHFKHLLKTFSSFGFDPSRRNLLFHFLISFIKFSHVRDTSQFVMIEDADEDDDEDDYAKLEALVAQEAGSQ